MGNRWVRGITILEIIIVLCIISILYAISASIMPRSVEGSRKRSAEFNLAAIFNAEKRYRLRTGAFYLSNASSLNNTSDLNAALGLAVEDQFFTYSITNTTVDDFKAVAVRTGGACPNATMEINSSNSTVVRRGCTAWK